MTRANAGIRHKINTLWTTTAPLGTAREERAPQRLRHDHIGNAVFWPLAIILVIHRIAVLAVNGSVTDDFSTVYYALRRFHEGVNIYNENYSFVDPHYLYSPGATLFLSPLAISPDFWLSRIVFILANAIAILAALGILTRLFGYSLRSMVWPASIAFAFCTEAVRNTLIFSNINGILLFAFTVFLWAFLQQGKLAHIFAGLVLGLAILIKPIFLPILFLAFVRWNWDIIIAALLPPVVLNAVAWPIVPGASDYVTKTMPYLREVRDYANSSLPGQAVYFAMPGWQKSFWFAVFAAVVIVGLIALLRVRRTDELLWATTTSGLLFTGVFFLSSLGQMYYSMLLFPMMFTVLQRRSVMHTWVAWLAAYGFLSPDRWASDRWPSYSKWAEFLKPTLGWAAMILVIAATAVVWWMTEQQRARAQAAAAASAQVYDAAAMAAPQTSNTAMPAPVVDTTPSTTQVPPQATNYQLPNGDLRD